MRAPKRQLRIGTRTSKEGTEGAVDEGQVNGEKKRGTQELRISQEWEEGREMEANEGRIYNDNADSR